MDIKKIKAIFERLVKNIESDPDNAFSKFMTEFKTLEFAERDVILPFVKRYHETVIAEDKLPLENQMYLTQVRQEIDDEHMGSDASVKG